MSAESDSDAFSRLQWLPGNFLLGLLANNRAKQQQEKQQT